jgi:hypothetical protein
VYARWPFFYVARPVQFGSWERAQGDARATACVSDFWTEGVLVKYCGHVRHVGETKKQTALFMAAGPETLHYFFRVVLDLELLSYCFGNILGY